MICAARPPTSRGGSGARPPGGGAPRGRAPAGERDADGPEGARLSVVVGHGERERLVEVVEQLVARRGDRGGGAREEEGGSRGRRGVGEPRSVGCRPLHREAG